MSERIKFNSIHKLLLEEKGLFQNQLNAIAMERQRYEEGHGTLGEGEKEGEPAQCNSNGETEVRGGDMKQ